MLPRPRPPVFLDLLDEVLVEDQASRGANREYRHYPSSASFKKATGKIVGACMRQLYYRATKQEITNPKDMTNRLQAGFGDAIHTWLTDKLQKSKKIKMIPEASGRVTVDELEKEISFRLDSLVTYRGELGGLEFKTMQSYGLQRMVKEGGPKDNHILQILSYFGTNDAIRWFSLVYFGRDSGFRAEYHVWKDPVTNLFMIEGVFPESKAKPVDELNFPGVVARWGELEGSIKAGVLPHRDFKAVLTKEGKVTDKRTKNHVDYKTDFACTYCEFQNHCWSLPDAKEHAYKIVGD